MPLRPGSSVALITPMEADTGRVDFPALERLLQFHLDEKTDNLCILGTTGEAATLSFEERGEVLKTAVKMVKGEIPILVGCGTINPQAVKEYTIQARDIGCDAALIVTPYYVKPPQRGLIRHAQDAASYGLPVLLYNVPGRTGSNISDESIAICAEHDNIVGVKDATGDLNRLSSLKQTLREKNIDDFLLYSGDDGTTMDFCLQGGHGCISVTANCAPRQMHDLVAASRAGDEAEARRINSSIEILHEKLFCESNPMPTKFALNRMGLTSSPYCRPPLDELDRSYHGVVYDALREAGLIK